MLSFFRKYQKYFLAVVTFFIAISFAFFGTGRSMGGKEERPNREIGKLVDGSKLMEQDLYSLIRLTQNGLEEGGRTVNLLSDSMIHRDIMLTGLGEILALHHFELLAEDLKDKWKRAKHFIPYVHPYAPHISAQNTWAQFAPEINDLLIELKAAPEEFTQEQLPLLFKLYQAQANFPPHLLHQMLYYSQSQGGDQVRPDPSLPSLNVALFGYQSIEEWFGPQFMEEVGKFIMNASLLAKQEGYKVSFDEAHVELLSNVYRGLKLYMQGKAPSSEEVQSHFVRQVRSIGLDEKSAIGLWQNVMHFRRFFHEVGESVFLDRLPFHQFKNFAKASNKVCRYELPQAFQFSDFDEMLKFQRYIEVTAKGDFLGLPTEFLSAEEVKKEHPELVYKPIEVDRKTVTKLEVAARISLKDTWEWEAEHYPQLQEQFPFLTQAAETVEECLAALDSLNQANRFRVDQFARRTLVEAHPERIEEALCVAPSVQETLKLGEAEPLLSLLEKRDPSLACFTKDGETFSSYEVLKNDAPWQLMSFEEANRAGILDQMLDTLLETAYEELHFTEPFEEIREQIALKVYEDLFSHIAAHASEKIQGYDDYARHRFDPVLEEAREKVVLGEEVSLLEKREDYLSDQGLLLEVGEFSEIQEGSFFQLLEREESPVSDGEVAQAKEILKRDAMQELMKTLLNKM